MGGPRSVTGSGKGLAPGTIQQGKNEFTVGSSEIILALKSLAWGEGFVSLRHYHMSLC